jgi:hypothetical protein
LLFLGEDVRLPAQYPPGGYPGGGYPPGGYPPGNYPPGNCAPGYPCEGGGISLPGRTKKKKKKDADQQDLQTITGILRKLDDKYVVVEATDTRVINAKRTADTKFLKNGDPLKPDVLKPGDHLYVEATQDDDGVFTAVNVNFEKEGTEQERARASEPVEIIEPVTQQSHGDPDRPTLHRKDSPPDTTSTSAPADKSAPSQPATAATNAPPQPAAAGKSAPPPAAAAELPPPVPPEAGLDLDHIPASTSSRQAVDNSDDGPPVLKRGKPAPRKATDAGQVALNSPPPPPSQSVPAPPPPAQPISAPVSSQAQQPLPERVSFETGPPVDARIEKARTAAESFTETLPDYVCQEQMARFQSATHVVSWQALDIVSAEVVYEKGKERYRNLAINGKLTKAQRMEDMPGSWSTGEFASVLMDVFSPATAAEFRYRRESRSGGRSAFVYDFSVDHDHSHWHIQVGSQSVLPAYKGSMWIDKETGRVLRIEMQAFHLPEEFPSDKVETASDYEFIRIGEKQFLLPVHAENLSCQRGSDICGHNVIDFRNYHKYAGEATIIFDK